MKKNVKMNMNMNMDISTLNRYIRSKINTKQEWIEGNEEVLDNDSDFIEEEEEIIK